MVTIATAGTNDFCSAIKAAPHLREWGLKEKQHVWEAVERRWSRVLDPLSVRVLHRVLDCTSNWGLSEWTGSVNKLVAGRDGEGEWAQGPLGISYRKVQDCIAILRDRGFLVTSNAPNFQGLVSQPQFDFITKPWESLTLPPGSPPPSASRRRNPLRGYAPRAWGVRRICRGGTHHVPTKEHWCIHRYF